jgi:hypothetical protein
VLLVGGRARGVHGVLEVARHRGDSPPRPGASRWPFVAITLGHVVIGTSEVALDRWRAHEHAHVRQYERWGVFFVAAYPLASCVSRWRGEGWYRGNRFEREARAVAGFDGVEPAEPADRPLKR